ncbi:AAA family ATPase [Pyxidicoccus xibeiensis]|uniref:AAA family ATPase n=1 Tax=Pyxidicoccus xibeiensis TaxID=2906759 RepID=UPI0020A744D7|nr:AAA family ATPase [Pyxidicoccus xibeiensis]MCP3139431.1 AAA family ATPase [Pyxidicoccus xibeiensis]
MRINRLELQNFRGFEDFKLDLDPDFTLLLGRNGAGKTAVLEALAVSIGEWFTGLRQVAGQVRYLRDDDVRQVGHMSEGVPSIEKVYPVKVTAQGTIADGQSVTWTRHILARGRRARSAGGTPVSQLAEGMEAAVIDGEDVDLPVISFYGTARLWLKKRDREGTSVTSRLHGYHASLEPASSTWQFEAWMQWREQARIERVAAALRAGQDASVAHEPQLEAVQHAAAACLPGAKNLYFSLNTQSVLVDLEDGRTLPFHLLSDGYRNLVALAADLAWRCVQLNPHHGVNAPKLARGIVLIDEIDLHLHPRWQRRVIGDLRKTFPGVQFVATTHSPQVLSTAENAWVRLLVSGEPEPRRVSHVKGKDTNALLEDIFAEPSRPQEMQRALDRLAKLIDGSKLEEARDLLNTLREQLGADDTDIVRADWAVRDLEDDQSVEDHEEH